LLAWLICQLSSTPSIGNTLHQGASNLSLSDRAANPPEVWLPAFFVGFGILGFFLIALILRTRNEILVRERRSQWVKDLINGSGQEEVNNA